MKSLRNAALCAVGAFVFGASAATAAPPQINWLSSSASNARLQPVSRDSIAPQQRILQSIDETQLVELVGNTRGEANEDNDLGRVDDSLTMDHMFLQLQRSPEQEAALKQYIDEETDRKSANFHKWLTAAEFGDKYGVAQSDLSTVKSWLEQHGFTVNVMYRNGMLIDFSGTAGQLREAFHTEIHNLNAKGEAHIANMSNPKIPVALAPVIAGIVSLHDFKPHTNFKHKIQTAAKPKGTQTAAKPKDTTTSADFPYILVPGDLATIYDLNPLFAQGFTGLGQTVAVIEDTNGGTNVTADVATFRSEFGLSTAYPSGTFTTNHPAPPTGTNNCTNPNVVAGDEVEAQLDVEWAGSSAPNAAIVMESCKGSSTFGGLIAIQNLINGVGFPNIMSVSYGECEAENGAASNLAFNNAYQQAASEGVSVFVSSGDESSTSCDADADFAKHGLGASGWGSSPYNVSVGGTDFLDTFDGTNATYWNQTTSTSATGYASALSYIPEQPWNDSCASFTLYTAAGYATGYGLSGFCNSSTAETDDNYLDTGSGSGAPSGCYSGQVQTSGVNGATVTLTGVVSGTCAGQPKPSWQSGVVGIPADGVRDIPDLSLFAANGLWGHYYVFCDSDVADKNQGNAVCAGQDPVNWSGAGGTSFSSPIMAGMQALINESAGGLAQGLPTPAYYSLAATEYGAGGSAACNSSAAGGPASSCVFYDVTQGDIDVNCITDSSTKKGVTTVLGTFDCFLDGATTAPNNNGVGSLNNTGATPTLTYGAGTGWDFATGIGTVNAFNLVAAYTGATGVGITSSTSGFSLSWSAPYVGVSGYNLYMSTTSGGEHGSTALQTGITGTSTTVSNVGLTPGTTYYFTVAAVNSNTSAVSVQSSEVSGSIPVLNTPNAFSFTPVTAVPYATSETSNSISVSGINVPVAVSITGGTFSQNGGAASTSGTANNGDSFTVTQTSASADSTTTTATLTIGGVSAGYAVTTGIATPGAFSFTPVTNDSYADLDTSNSISVTGTNIPSAVSITGGQYSQNGNPYTSAPGTANSGDTFTVQVTSASTDSTTTTATLSIGGVSGAYSTTTGVETPGAFSFTAQTGVALNTLATSNPISVSNITEPTSISIVGGQYSINGGSYTSHAPVHAPSRAMIRSVNRNGKVKMVSAGKSAAKPDIVAVGGMVSPGDTVTVQLTSSGSYSTLSTATLTIGGVSANFNVTTYAEVTTPTAFSFTPVTKAPLSTSETSNAITVSGTNGPSSISIVGGTYSVGGGPATSNPGTVQPGNSVTVTLTSSASFATATKATLTIGGVSASYTVTTAAKDTTPGTLSFKAVTGAQPNTLETSNTVTVTDINTSVPVAITGGSYSQNGGPYTSAPGTANLGDTFTLQQTSSSSFSTATTADITIGGARGLYVVTTIPPTTSPSALTFTAVTGAQPSTAVTSNSVTIAGLSTGYTGAVSITGGSYSIGCNGTFTTAASTISNGQTVCVQLTSSSGYTTKTTATLLIGTTKGLFSVTTRAIDTTPTAFSFTAVTGAALLTTETSNTITVSGMDPTAVAAISIAGTGGGQYSVNGGPYTSSAGTISNGATVTLQVTSSATALTKVEPELTIGTVHGFWSVTTGKAP